jgi:hypothetical protein
MKRIDAGFAVGFLLGVSTFILLNAYTYYAGSARFNARTIHFSHDGFYWGFPFPWFYVGTCFPCDLDAWFRIFGFLANVGIGLTVSLAAGFAGQVAVRRIWADISMK